MSFKDWFALVIVLGAIIGWIAWGGEKIPLWVVLLLFLLSGIVWESFK